MPIVKVGPAIYDIVLTVLEVKTFLPSTKVWSVNSSPSNFSSNKKGLLLSTNSWQ
ncbi:hypothetical protein ES703_118979 [subsurface metagenome]